MPHGRPFRTQDADPAVLSALADYPLLPGNQWVYRDDNYSMGIWGGAVLTRTVRSAELLNPELLLVRMDTEQTPVVKGNPDLYNWLGHWSELEYLLLWRDELYRTSDPARVLRWIDHFSAPGPIPTTAPCDVKTQQATGCFSPDLLLPVRAGQTVSAPEVSQTWEWRTAPFRSMPVGRFDDCFEAFIIGSGATWRLYCRGVGEVRNEHISSCCYSGITQLTSYHLAASMAAPSSTATEPAQEDGSN